RTLPEDFEQTVIASFDTRYQTNLQRLAQFHTDYRNAANALVAPLQKIPSEAYPQIDVKPYTDKLEVLKAAIQSNLDAINEKRDHPASSMSLSRIAPVLEELAVIINGFNA